MKDGARLRTSYDWRDMISNAPNLDRLCELLNQYEETDACEKDQEYWNMLSRRWLPVFAKPDPDFIGSLDEETGETIYRPSVVDYVDEKDGTVYLKDPGAYSWDEERVLVDVSDVRGSAPSTGRWELIPRADTD